MMKNFVISIFALVFLAACERNIGSNVYTQSNTIGVVLEGEVVSARQVTVKDNDRLQDNKMGGLIGAAAGGIGANNIGKGRGRTAATIGGGILGAAIGAAAQDYLSTQQGMEYIVKVSTEEFEEQSRTSNINLNQGSVSKRLKGSVQSSNYRTKLISVVQGLDTVFQAGQKVFVMYNDDNRARLVAR